MEGIESTPAPAVAPQVAPPVVNTPAPAPVSAPAVSTEPSFDSSSDNSLMGTLKSLNWLEITFGIAGAIALYYTIYYYRYNMINGDKSRTEMQNRIDALEIKLAELEEEDKNTPQILF
jgi:hypothetical protein